MTAKIKIPKKLIEVALPLDDINAAAIREKSIRHGHPSILHLWWARRPLAVARAVIFAQMVNDPGYQQGDGFKYGVNKKQAAFEREKLFDIIRDLVKWENTNNEEVLNRARVAIKKSWREICELNKDHPQVAELFNPNKLPAFHDPFAGGGTVPLEAQRLGLESYASDLNPVAVMINKAMIEIPPRFAGQEPVGPIPDADKMDKKRSTKDVLEDWSGATGLAEDVRRYGHWMREQAANRIGHLYPKIDITSEIVSEQPDLKPYEGQQFTVIVWLWARTVNSPNPAFSHVAVPLVRSFVLSSKKGRETWIKPIIDGDSYTFKIRKGRIPDDECKGTVERSGGTCLLSGVPIPFKYIREEGKAGRIGYRLLAVVAKSDKSGRCFITPTPEMEAVSNSLPEVWMPEALLPKKHRNFQTPAYGMVRVGDLFTTRQLHALNTMCDLVKVVKDRVEQDCKSAGFDSIADDYSQAIAIYIGLAVSRSTNTHNSLAVWSQGREQSVNLFSRQAIPMTWDFPEVNLFGGAAGDFAVTTTTMSKTIANFPANAQGYVFQAAAQYQDISENKIISTDPPYYDNIAYADLSDFFYSWLRRSYKGLNLGVFSTISTPKEEELVASPNRHGNKEKAEVFFLDGMTQAMTNLSERCNVAFPVTIYYAFKQSETKNASTTNTGWETFLGAVIKAGFRIDGTWPMRTERPTGVKASMNALASSIILVCQKRIDALEVISRRQFQRQLREEMPEALEAMIGGSEGASPIAPVDLAQAAIGPGIGIFSRYEAVLNQDGSKMSVHDALILINRAITDYLNPHSGSFDNDTLFCDGWFAEYGWSTGEFGQANVLAQGKGTTVDGVRDAGVIESGGGKVRLLTWREYPTDWDPKQDNRTPVWEALHHLIRALNQAGESGAGKLLAGMPERGESIRQLAYHLYTFCERKKWAEDARAYNELIASWHAIVAASHEVGQHGTQVQMELDA